jgi:hypothetical protein
VIEDLYYRFNESWVKVPAWARYFFEVGLAAAAAQVPGTRFVLGLAVPTRSYAAALAACGVVVARASQPAEQSSPVEHFAQVCDLPIDATVSLLNGDKKLKGVFTGCDNYKGEKVARIMVHSKSAGGGTYLIRAADALRVEILPGTQVRLPKKQSGRLVPQMTGFVRHFVGDDKAMAFAMQSRLECVISGRANVLRREILETEFAVSTSQGVYDEGCLQDLLQVRKFLGEGESYRSEICRVNGRVHMFANEAVIPPFAIFDGATGFIRWRDSLRNSNWIVILDWTDARFREATEILKEAHMNRTGDDKIMGLPPPPAGVDVLDFYERSR